MLTPNECKSEKITFLYSLYFIGAFIVHILLWIYPLDMKEKEKRTSLQYISSLILIFIMFLGIGVIFHRIFGIKSALSAYLGFNDMPIRSA